MISLDVIDCLRATLSPADLAAYDTAEFVEPWKRADHLDLLNEALVMGFHGVIKRLACFIPPRYGKPVSIDSLILCGDGSVRKLGTIRKGDYVITHRGRPRIVKGVFKQGKRQCLRITTHSGRSTVAALDHPFLTPEGWVDAKDLQVGQSLANVPNPKCVASPQRLLEEFRLAGYLVGDGHIGSASVTCLDTDQGRDISYCAKKLGFGCRIEHRSANAGKHAPVYRLTDGIRDWLRNNQIYGLSRDKRVPQFVFTASDNEISHFLGAYFACDGTVNKKGKPAPSQANTQRCTVEFYSISHGLMKDTQHLLLRLGIQSRLREKIGPNGYLSYRLILSRQNDVATFIQKIPVYGRKKVRLREWGYFKTFFTRRLFADHITKIEDVGLVDCRCLKVDEDNTFTSDDFVVHNSYLTSKYLPPWWLGKRPDDRVILTSYSNTLAMSHSEYARDVLRRQGRKLFGVRPKPGAFAKSDWQIDEKQGGMRSAGVGTGIAGFGANLFIIDDAVADKEQAYSEKIQERNWGWWSTVASNRLQPGALLVYIQTRWHVKDLAGKLLDRVANEPDADPIVVIRFPEWAEEDELIPVSIVGGKNKVTPELTEWVEEQNADTKYHRKIGQVLWPEYWTEDAVKGRKAVKDELEWQSVHQQKPNPSEGLLFEEEFFTLVDSSPIDAIRVRYWDLAATEGGGDWLVGCLMSYSPEEEMFYIEDIKRGQWGPGEVELNVKNTARLDGYNTAIRIEEEGGASGKLTINSFIRALPDYDVAGRRPTGQKHIRWRRMLAPLQRGNMAMVIGPWNRTFVSELIQLPGGEHDDQADAAAGAYAELVELDKSRPGAEVL